VEVAAPVEAVDDIEVEAESPSGNKQGAEIDFLQVTEIAG
jgi:hypothetical protein